MSRQTIYLASLFIALLCFLLPLSLSANVIEQVVVVVDREPYTLTDLKEYAKTRMGREFPAGDLDSIKDQDREVLEQFITEKLLAEEVKVGG